MLIILSGAAVMFVAAIQGESASELAARRIADDVTLAQAAAIAARDTRDIVFDGATGRYGVYAGGAPIPHPLTRRDFVVNLDTIERGARVDLTGIDFGGGDTLRFDARGTPASGGHLGVQCGNAGWTITVAAVTGAVTVTPDP